ncbi:MAG: beta-galactosidase [Tannerella sp.]|jgi:hypothetical protein|nr:beta-galactosidase [Tannerella sp.]
MKPFLITFLCCTALWAAKAQVRYDFDLDRSAAASRITHDTKWSETFRREVLQVKSDENGSVLSLAMNDTVDWGKVRYMVCEVCHPGEHTIMLNICLFRRGEPLSGPPRLSCSIAVLPKLKTQVVFPLEYLSAQRIFLPRFPRQLKGVVTGNRIEPEDIAAMSLQIFPAMSPLFAPTVEIASVYLTDGLPPDCEAPQQKYVDRFGQWTLRDWPGKIKSEAELKQKMVQVEKSAAKATYPKGWSSYGGLKALRFDSTGFFRVQHDGQRWWFVDPEGYAFLSAGVNGVTARQSGVYNGMEDLLEWMPDRQGAFASIYEEGEHKRIDYYKANQLRVYGDRWLDKWLATTPGLMKQWRFNTVGNWADRGFAQKSGLPYVHHMGEMPVTRLRLYRDFPDVFSPEYRELAAQYARQLLPLREDRRLIGYFLCNEPKWAFGDQVLAFEMFASPQLSYTKLHLVAWLKEKYPRTADFNAAWNVSYASIDELLMQTFKDAPSEAAEKDFREFTAQMVEEWIRIICEETKKADPNHLNLGMRYAWISSDVLVKPARHFDVLSMSAYTAPFPPPTEEISRISGRPVLLSEWHFGSALDAGLPTSGLQTVISQAERGKAYRTYAEHGFSRPEIIGMHWFQWTDQPLLGRGDGENYNIGLLDACSLPYPDLTEAARMAHENMYDLARGRKKPYFFKLTPTPTVKAQE